LDSSPRAATWGIISPNGGFSESEVEEAALAWLGALGYAVAHGPDIAPGELAAQRRDYGQVLLEDRLRQALARLNPTPPAKALEDAFRKVVRVEGATPEARNRAFHRMLVDGVTVEYRRPDGSIAGAQVRLVDFAAQTDVTDKNDWRAVNQFTVSENKHTRRPVWRSTAIASRSRIPAIRWFRSSAS
jgi:type I restriction enzyme R subunit